MLKNANWLLEGQKVPPPPPLQRDVTLHAEMLTASLLSPLGTEAMENPTFPTEGSVIVKVHLGVEVGTLHPLELIESLNREKLLSEHYNPLAVASSEGCIYTSVITWPCDRHDFNLTSIYK